MNSMASSIVLPSGNSSKGTVVYPTGKMTVSEYVQNLKRFSPDKRPDFKDYDSVAVAAFRMVFQEAVENHALNHPAKDSPEFKSRIIEIKEKMLSERFRDQGIPQKFGDRNESLRLYKETNGSALD